VSRIQFGFGFIVNPDPDPIIEYPLYRPIHFRRLLLRNGILPGAKFTLRPPSLAFCYWQRYCTAVEQWARAKLCGVVEHRAPPIFGRATIILGIGSRSSIDLICRSFYLGDLS